MTTNCLHCSNFHDIMDAKVKGRYNCECRCHLKEQNNEWLYDRRNLKMFDGPVRKK